MSINKKIKVILILLSITVICKAQIQMGDDIDGKFENDLFGASIAMSADGQTIAIGGDRNNGMGHQAGHVRVYKCFADDKCHHKSKTKNKNSHLDKIVCDRLLLAYK